MKMPKLPPKFDIRDIIKDDKRLSKVFEASKNPLVFKHYLHWDKLRHHKVDGLKSEDLWAATKLHRMGNLKPISMYDKSRKPFVFCIPDSVQESLHKIDVRCGAAVGVPEPITNPQTKDKYLIRSLMEEAITSSQLEGAATTRDVAKEMIRTGRQPRDKDEQMILNNFVTMQRISKLKDKPLSSEMVFEIHRLVTEKTLPDECADGAGRFRRPDEKRIVGEEFSDVVFHDPPPAEELEERLKIMCEFANENAPGYFIHPVIRAIILHFWIGYDHPFVDGNGRTARAIFYWSMLHNGYWLFEFISISTILRKAPIKYGQSFLYTETDENDLTYFIVSQIKVIQKAIDELHTYIDRKATELKQLESQILALDFFNHRQVDLIKHALKHPYGHYTIESHRKSHNIVYQTARTDLLNLKYRGIVEQRMVGKKMMFVPAKDLNEKLLKMGK
jgi:Fic family protein